MSIEILPAAKFDYSTIPKTLLNPEESYKIIKFLGSGTSSTIFLIRANTTDKLYALRFIDPLYLDPKHRAFYEEILILKELSAYPRCNEDIVCYYDDFQFRDIDGTVKYVILMEYIDGTILLQKWSESTLTDKNILEIALWLTKVIALLHLKYISHNDIGMQNIMIDFDNRLKLIDFGLSAINKTTSDFENGIKYDDTEVGELLYRLANKVNHIYDSLHNIKPTKFTIRCFNDVVEKLISKDPQKHITSEQANLLFQDCYAEHFG